MIHKSVTLEEPPDPRLHLSANAKDAPPPPVFVPPTTLSLSMTTTTATEK